MKSKRTSSQATARELWQIFLVMLRIGAITFGGGYAMIPQMSRDFVEKYGFIEQAEIVDLFAAAQSAPGVLAVNAAVLVGYRVAGTAGALVAAIGSVLPSLIVLSIVTLVYRAFIENPFVNGAMRGVRAAVTALLLSALCKLHPISVKGASGWLIFLAALVLTIFVPSLNAIWIITAGGLSGFLFLRRGQQGAS